MKKHLFGILLLLSIGFSSCVRMNMFSVKNEFESYQLLLNQKEPEETPIRIGDKFSVSVWKHEELSIGSIYGIYNSNEVFGKWQLVKNDSTITLPQIGTLKLVGMTISEAEAYLKTIYAEIIIDPVVTIQIHSHTVDILGQVKSAGQIVLYHQKHTISEALALVGGYTDYANISKVKLVRDGVGYEIDLTRITPQDLSRLFIKPGDLIVIPTKNSKFIEQKSSLMIATASVITTILIILNRK